MRFSRSGNSAGDIICPFRPADEEKSCWAETLEYPLQEGGSKVHSKLAAEELQRGCISLGKGWAVI